MHWIRGLLSSRWAVDGAALAAALAPVLLASDLPPDARLSHIALRTAAVPAITAAVLIARRLPAVAAATPAVLAVAAAGSLYTDQLAVAGILLAYLLGRRTAGRRAVVLLAACLGAVASAQATWPEVTARDWFQLGTTALLVTVLPWTVGQLVHQHARLLRAGWNLAEQLEREQERVADQVRLRERARIATDMHDSLGHELSLFAVRAATLQVDAGISDEGRRAAADLRRAASDATDRLREIIGMLRDDGDTALLQPAGVPVEELVRRAAASGVEVTLDDRVGELPTDPPVPDATARAARRVVQEGLTNATRHALGRPVRVTLSRDADHLFVRVANDLPEPAPESPRGYGLIGLDERVRLAGGRLGAGPTDGEFAVCARLPLQNPVAPAPPSDALRSRHAEADARRALLRGLAGTFWPPAVIALLLALLYLADGGWA
ncbi:sensor histidine kinase [Streptomonospora sp. PA3]|uniref:sensor histidine kinase n=1 Tax=Streptomonospora sp. PA3 TaxID=2607326 RepID=UPI0012DC3EF2|nr:histidine kinase [Streptomonospora sp. PA3]MUL43213.1 sensor histidine kinase [Streptomonospora sp. PA3]